MGYPPLSLQGELPQRLLTFQPWITRIDPNGGRNGVTPASLSEPFQVDGISVIAASQSGIAGKHPRSIPAANYEPGCKQQT